MNAYLLRHAIEHIWCTPGQDRQYSYQLARLTPKRGITHTINLYYERLPLPTQTDTYHVYQLGQVLPQRVNLPSQARQWVSLAHISNELLLHTDLYTQDGIQFPRFDSYVWLTPSRNVIVAVKLNPFIGDLDQQELYLRFYSNAYFQSHRSDDNAYLKVAGLTIGTENELIGFQRDIKKTVDTYGGYPQYFVNGRFVSNISLVTAQVGDTVEFVLDSSIKKMVEFDIDDLPTFTSTLDMDRKYILHYDDPTVNQIEYLDDVDLYLMDPKGNGRFSGVWYHHNEGNWLRMLTHKDYSIPIERLESFVQHHPEDLRHQINPSRWPSDAWSSLSGKVLRLYIRHSGYERPLVPNANRILELYRLSSERIIGAMTGTLATLDLWRAENLERSAYVRFMSASNQTVYPLTYGRPSSGHPEKDAAQAFVGDVYGYHVAATILAHTPTSVYTRDGVRYSDLAFEHQLNATVFEYDEDGVLLGWYWHIKGTYYIPRHTDTVRVEALSGRGTREITRHYGNENVDIPYGHNVRVYIRQVFGGVRFDDWIDITDVDNRGAYGFFRDNGDETRTWVWAIDPTDYYGLVWVDDRFLCYDLTLTRNDGHLRFSVNLLEHQDGALDEYLMTIPPGQLDIYLNGRALIEDIDYVVRWPEVVLTHLEYMDPAEDTVVLTVRGYGFPNPDLSRLNVTETGFLRYGVLSHDRLYSVHSYKQLRVIIDGHYRDPAALHYEEDREGLVIDGERNGAPYALQRPPVVFRDVYPDDITARQEDDVRDTAVANYMDEYFPKDPVPGPDFITTQYHIISPFANKLLHDLREGLFYPVGIKDHYSERDIRHWCQAYEWLLPYDLCNQEYVDSHIEIYPHWHGSPVALTLYQYTFYQRALMTYLRHPPDISAFVYVV